MDVAASAGGKGDLRDKVIKLTLKSTRPVEEEFLKAIWDIYNKGGVISFQKPTKKGRLSRRYFLRWVIRQNGWYPEDEEPVGERK